MTDTRIDYQLRAEKQFKKAALATEGAKAMSEYKAEVEAERAKTERLRALRLAKEAAGKKKNEQRYAAIVFLALSVAVIAVAAMVVQAYLQRR